MINFFKPDSYLESKEIPYTFKYLKIKKHPTENKDLSLPANYPIFVHLNENGFVFYCHIKTKYKQENINDSERIFSVSLEEFNREKLHQTLNNLSEIGVERFDILGQSGGYTIDREIYERYNKYSEYELDEQKWFTAKELFIDFLCDFYFANTYVDLPFYHNLKRKMENDPFLRVIIYRNFKNRKALQNINQKYQNLSNWFKDLRAKETNTFINPDSGWFKGLEKEYELSFNQFSKINLFKDEFPDQEISQLIKNEELSKARNKIVFFHKKNIKRIPELNKFGINQNFDDSQIIPVWKKTIALVLNTDLEFKKKSGFYKELGFYIEWLLSNRFNLSKALHCHIRYYLSNYRWLWFISGLSLFCLFIVDITLNDNYPLSRPFKLPIILTSFFIGITAPFTFYSYILFKKYIHKIYSKLNQGLIPIF